jgi:rSAM/selenodomain-associated transferase 2/rSAM/selenodomain-associated transferase 1
MVRYLTMNGKSRSYRKQAPFALRYRRAKGDQISVVGKPLRGLFQQPARQGVSSFCFECPMERKQTTQCDRLIVFGRYPVPGHTKTRLIPALGPTRAADLQRYLTEKTLKTAKAVASRGGMEVEACFEARSQTRLRRWLGSGMFLSRQGSGDLGERMEAAFHNAFLSGCRRAILFGTDIPGLAAQPMEEAFRRLDTADLVLGPSTDGGYWLMGLRKLAPADVFRGIPWGGRDVLEKTIARAKEHGMTVHLLDPLTDMDTVEELKKWMPEWMHSSPYISVIVPVLNEASNVDRSIASAQDPEAEIIVVDGGSADETVEIASQAGVRIVRSSPGRALQQNIGAAVARGEVLLFLHADTRLPKGYVAHVFDALLDPGTSVGAFLFRTDLDKPLMKGVEFLANLRSRYLKLPYGDQALFARKTAFERAGGFPIVPIAEDLFLVKELRKRGNVYIISAPAVTSGRRWEKLGVVRTTLMNQVILAGLALNISHHTLARLYRHSKR